MIDEWVDFEAMSLFSTNELVKNKITIVRINLVTGLNLIVRLLILELKFCAKLDKPLVSGFEKYISAMRDIQRKT